MAVPEGWRPSLCGLALASPIASLHGRPRGALMAQMRMRQSMSQIELAFEQEMALERRRREQLRKRAVNRSRPRRITRNESRGKVRFSVLLVCLTITVVTVVVVMFETLDR